MNPLLYTLPEDLTGKAPTNLRRGEYHDLSHLVGQPFRCFTLDHGYFFSESVLIEDGSGNKLKEFVDYKLLAPSAELIKETGLEVCAVVVIHNPKAASEFYVTAQMVGGPKGLTHDALSTMANRVLNSNRAVQWRYVDDKPDRYRPSGHLHAMWELYQFEGLMGSTQRVSAALRMRSRQLYQQQQNTYATRMAAVKQKGDAEKAKLAQHVARKDNPHRLTATQVKLNLVANYGLATTQDATAKATDLQTKYMTPASGKLSLGVNFGDAINAHKADISRPHKETADQVDTYLIAYMNDVLRKKLDRQAVAADSLLFDGRAWANAFNTLRQNLPVAALANSGRIDLARLGALPANRNAILTGAGWRNIQAIFDAYVTPATPVLYVTGLVTGADTTVAGFASTFKSYPTGTIVFFTDRNTEGGYNGNGTTTIYWDALFAAVKLSNGSFTY